MSAKNKLQKTLHEVDVRNRMPNSRSMQPSFGQVKKVSDNERQVEVIMFRESRESVNIGWHPVVDDTEDIHNRFGKISPEMCCIIWWQGESIPRQGSTWVQILSKGPLCAGKNLIAGTPKENEISTGPYKLFSGGLGM
jgi:hypothetical protein